MHRLRIKQTTLLFTLPESSDLLPFSYRISHLLPTSVTTTVKHMDKFLTQCKKGR